jgi:Uma2 family endonuclease
MMSWAGAAIGIPCDPAGWPIKERPDWVCEHLSPRHEKHDLVDKLRTLHAIEAPYYWIVNPEEKVLVVHRWESAGYLVLLTASSGELVHAPPFDAIALRVGVLFGDEDEDEDT